MGIFQHRLAARGVALFAARLGRPHGGAFCYTSSPCHACNPGDLLHGKHTVRSGNFYGLQVSRLSDPARSRTA